MEPSDDRFIRRVIHSGFWASSLTVVNRLLQLGKIAILANLLSPADFGIIGIALFSINALRQVSKTGFDEALIQHKEQDVNSFFDTVWIVKTVRGIVIAGVLYLSAPYIAEFFGEPRVLPILRVLGILVVMEGLTNPSVIYFQKELAFHKQFLYKLSGTIIDVVVALSVAFVMRSVWALVFGLLAGRMVQMVGSHLFVQYTPKLRFRLEYAKELFNYGGWITIASLSYFIVTTVDDAFVGWLLAASALGLYQVAFRFSNTPATQITNVIAKVLFPAYSKLRDNPDAMRKAYVNTFTVISIITIPMTVGLILLAPDFTAVVLGDKWMSMVPAFRILALSGLLRAVPGASGALYRGSGNPEWVFYENLPRLAILGITIWPLTNRFGITGTAISVVMAIAATFPITLYKTADITGLVWRRYWDRVAFPIIGAFIMGLVVSAITAPSMVRLTMSVLVGATVYFATIYLIYNVTGRHHLKWFLSKI